MNEALNSRTRPPNMPDLEWESVGLLCLVQLSEHGDRMVRTKDPIDNEIGFVYFDMLLRQMVNWFVADRNHRGRPFNEKQLQNQAVRLGEMMLKIRGELRK